MINEYEGLVRLLLMSPERREEMRHQIHSTAMQHQIHSTAFDIVQHLDANSVPMSTGVSAMFYIMIKMQEHAQFHGPTLRLMFDRMKIVSEEIDKIKGNNE